MALRVLLADESSTIKKVFQLALQDFAVDVRPVNVGVDVIPVAQNFKPDIIFADVLLQKKSGYDVAAEIKQNATLNGIPVVLMWSGFMELDEDKFQASHANAQLEKPFDVTALRKLVTDLVPRTQSQRLSQFLNFPKLPELEEKPAPEAPRASDEDFTQVPIPSMKPSANKYRLDLKPEELDPAHVPVEFGRDDDVDALLGSEENEPFTMHEPSRPHGESFSQNSPSAEVDLEPEDGAYDLVPPPAPTSASVPAAKSAIATSGQALTEAQLEKIIREQSAQVIESVVWKVVPDLAAQIIERELNRLLKERDSQPY